MAERTKELAGKALEALDVPEDGEGVERPSPPSTPTPGLEKSHVEELGDDASLLGQLVEVLTGQATTNPLEAAEVLVTQLRLVRENSGRSGGSLVTLLNELVSEETTQSLLEALEAEQAENFKLRQRLAMQLKSQESVLLEEKVKELEVRVLELEDEKQSQTVEMVKTQRMLTKVIQEKAELELESDNEDKIDSRIMRSAFTTLCSQIDNKSVRDGILLVMAEMLHISPEDRLLFRVPQPNSSIERKPSGLGDEFIKFLNSEVETSPKETIHS